MPYKSEKQRKYIHAAAAKGKAWAQKFVKDSEAEVPKRKRVKKAAKKKRR